jgi:hypothetical protein
MASGSTRKIPWTNQMRRLHGESAFADWMAPESVVQTVQTDYLNAVSWMHDSPALPWTHQWRNAANYLAGQFLRRYQNILLRQRSERPSPCYGVLRGDHDVRVRGFSADGRRSWLIDIQTGRRIATYTSETHERVVTQDMGDGAVVVQMLYEPEASRWKIEAIIQELPVSWQQHRKITLTPEHPALRQRIGRDS